MVDYRWRVWVTVWHLSTCDNWRVISVWITIFFPSRVDALTTNVVRKSHAHCITTEKKKKGCTLTIITILLETECESLSPGLPSVFVVMFLYIQVVLTDDIRPFRALLGLNLELDSYVDATEPSPDLQDQRRTVTMSCRTRILSWVFSFKS